MKGEDSGGAFFDRINKIDRIEGGFSKWRWAGGQVARRDGRVAHSTQNSGFDLSLKIVNHDLLDVGFDVFRHELEMLRVDLIVVLGLFAGEGGVQGELITLIDYRAGAADHFTDMEFHDAGNVFEVFVGAGYDLIRRIGIRRVRPENDNMREHGFILTTTFEFGYRFGKRV